MAVIERGKIQQFIHAEELGDGKLSELFRRLQRLYGNGHRNLFVRAVFTATFEQCASQSTVTSRQALDELVLIADGMMKIV